MVSVIAFRLVRKEPIYLRVTDTTEKRRSCRSPPENRRRPQATTGEPSIECDAELYVKLAARGKTKVGLYSDIRSLVDS